MAKHVFGGDWTSDKLERVRKYLCAYTTIFSGNESARYFTTVYVDAFAGTGERADSSSRKTKLPASIFEDDDSADAEALQKGSARIALEVEPPFDSFLFIEQSIKRVKELELLRTEFPDRAETIQIERGDANDVLRRWCQQTNWRSGQ